MVRTIPKLPDQTVRIGICVYGCSPMRTLALGDGWGPGSLIIAIVNLQVPECFVEVPLPSRIAVVTPD